MKKLLLVYILFPMLSFAQGSENPPPPMGARATEDIEAGVPAPGLTINNSLCSILSIGLVLSISGAFFTKYRFEK